MGQVRRARDPGRPQACGAKYISTDAGSSAEQQLTDVENLITQGANVLIILAQDGEAILPAVQSALDQGIPVVAYDRLIEDPDALYLTFDNVEVGRLQAQAVYGAVPKGNYVFIKGNSADANADFLRRASRRSCRTRSTRVTSSTSASPTRTTGTRRSPRRTWSSS